MVVIMIARGVGYGMRFAGRVPFRILPWHLSKTSDWITVQLHGPGGLQHASVEI